MGKSRPEEVIEMCLNKKNQVIMSNSLIRSKSNLSLNEIKLLRITIMQVVKEDQDFKSYKVSIKKLVRMLGIDHHNMYRDIYNICKNLLSEVVYIGDDPKKKWKMFQWCSSCAYDNGIITIRLHDNLKPYLLGLSGLYTQYVLDNILSLKSTYSIRVYELIEQEKRNQSILEGHKASVYLPLDVIRKATNTEEKYADSLSMFEKRVIKLAVAEINEKTNNCITYTRKKDGKRVVGYRFRIIDKGQDASLGKAMSSDR